MPQRRQPPTSPKPLPEMARADVAPNVQRPVDVLNEGEAATLPAAEPQTSRLEPFRRAARQLPDFRTRDNIEQ
jgi:hypothetical protein